jgi:hypothetical protein
MVFELRPGAQNQVVWPTLDQSTASPAYQLIPVTPLRVLTWKPGCAIQSQAASCAMISAQRLCFSTRWSQVS